MTARGGPRAVRGSNGGDPSPFYLPKPGPYAGLRRFCDGIRVGLSTPWKEQFHHPVVGELTLTFNRLDLAADHGLTIFTYAAEPGSRSEEALNLLGSWAATVDAAESTCTAQ